MFKPINSSFSLKSDSNQDNNLKVSTSDQSSKWLDHHPNSQIKKEFNQLAVHHLNNNHQSTSKRNHPSRHFSSFKSNLMSYKTCLPLFILLIVFQFSLVVSVTDNRQSTSLDNESRDNKLLDKVIEEKDQNLKEKTFLNEFAIELDASSCPATDQSCKAHLDKKANDLAAKHGFVNTGQIGQLDGHYLFRHHQVAKRSTDYADHHHNLLDKETEVLWVEQQEVKIRQKRDNEKDSYRFAKAMPDPLFDDQWYINKGAKGGFDMNVEKAWQIGYSGKGVVVTILDDGIQPNHPDLELNYDPLASYDINDDDNDPTPQDNGDNKHGTRCAGEVAGQAYNEFCGVGIAFNASIGGVRMLDGTVTDSVEAKALSLNSQHIDIYSASWGPGDDGRTVDGQGRLAKRAFLDGINKGRKGLGSIYVWASGNGGRRSDNCNCDGYTSISYQPSYADAAVWSSTRVK